MFALDVQMDLEDQIVNFHSAMESYPTLLLLFAQDVVLVKLLMFVLDVETHGEELNVKFQDVLDFLLMQPTFALVVDPVSHLIHVHLVLETMVDLLANFQSVMESCPIKLLKSALEEVLVSLQMSVPIVEHHLVERDVKFQDVLVDFPMTLLSALVVQLV